jgi:putative PIN family toxin of toxin-antitoxin system
MRLVVDTNVFVSAVLKANSLPFLVVRWIEQNGGLLKSLASEQELTQVLRRPHIMAVTSPSFGEGVRKLLAGAELVTVRERIAVCRDPKDDKFLELAINGRADLIVSGDTDLLALDPFRGIPIVTPAGFVRDVVR